MNDGKFFEKQAAVTGGRFMESLPGRSDGNFFKAATGQLDQGGGALAPAQPAAGGGGGIYGTGTGTKKKPIAKVAEAESQIGGQGWHRATDEQPTALPAGGSRFLQDSNGATPSNAESPVSGLNKGQTKVAAPRFLGTSFEKRSGDNPVAAGKDIASDVRDNAGKQVGKLWDKGTEGMGSAARYVADSGGKLVNSVTSSSAASAAVLGGIGLLALKGGKGALAKLILRKKKPAGLGASLARKIGR